MRRSLVTTAVTLGTLVVASRVLWVARSAGRFEALVKVPAGTGLEELRRLTEGCHASCTSYGSRKELVAALQRWSTPPRDFSRHELATALVCVHFDAPSVVIFELGKDRRLTRALALPRKDRAR